MFLTPTLFAQFYFKPMNLLHEIDYKPDCITVCEVDYKAAKEKVLNYLETYNISKHISQEQKITKHIDRYFNSTVIYKFYLKSNN